MNPYDLTLTPEQLAIKQRSMANIRAKLADHVREHPEIVEKIKQARRNKKEFKPVGVQTLFDEHNSEPVGLQAVVCYAALAALIAGPYMF